MDGIFADWASYTAIATHSVLIVLMCDSQGKKRGKENLILNSMITAGWDMMQICSDYYSTWFDVSTTSISNQNYNGWYGMQMLTILVTACGFALIPMIPTTREAFVEWANKCRKVSWLVARCRYLIMVFVPDVNHLYFTMNSLGKGTSRWLML